MAEPSDILTRLHEVPGAAPDDATLHAILDSGRRKRRRRHALVPAAAAFVTAIVVATILVAAPRGRTTDNPVKRSDECTLSQLRVTTSALIVQTEPRAFDSISLSIQTRRPCALTGPLQLQVHAPDGTWSAVAARGDGDRVHHAGDTGPQTSATLRLDPPTTYLIDLGWKPTSSHCRARDVRLVGPRLLVPLAQLPQWCGQPIAVSNTFPGSVTYSVPWVSATPSGKILTIRYRPQCRGARPIITETPRTVTVALVTTYVTGPGGCVMMPTGLVRLNAKLGQPLGDRTLIHAHVGRWPAIDVP